MITLYSMITSLWLREKIINVQIIHSKSMPSVIYLRFNAFLEASEVRSKKVVVRYAKDSFHARIRKFWLRRWRGALEFVSNSRVSGLLPRQPEKVTHEATGLTNVPRSTEDDAADCSPAFPAVVPVRLHTAWIDGSWPLKGGLRHAFRKMIDSCAT